MGVDYTARRFVGSKNKEDLAKLPQEIREELEEAYDINDGPWEGLRLWVDHYHTGETFIAFGFHFQSVEFNPTEEVPVPEQYLDMLRSIGIDAKVYSFVEIW